MNGAVPPTPTANVALLPAFTRTPPGGVVMVGTTGAGTPAVTLSVASLLVALPAALLTTTL